MHNSPPMTDPVSGQEKTPTGETKSKVLWLIPALTAGLVASTLGVLVMIALRFITGTPTIPELIAERILPHVSYTVVLYLLRTTGKVNGTGLNLLGQWASGIVLGVVYCGIVRHSSDQKSTGPFPSKRGWLVAAAVGMAALFVAVILFWPVLPENLFGFSAGQGRLISILTLAIILGVYAAALALVWAALTPDRVPKTQFPETSNGVIDRRTVLARSGLAAIATLVVGGGGATILIRYFLSRSASYDGFGATVKQGELPALTPNDHFYVVTKNVLDPAPRLSDWSFEVGGLVNNPGGYGSLSDLQRLPHVQRVVTLECISLTVANHLISTARWDGVLLEEVLKDRGGTKPGTTRIVFHSADGYTSSLPLDVVLANKSFLAWHMNGVPLPNRHGFPLRAIVPGYYGEKSAKWLVGIELIDHDFQDFYTGEGWAGHPSKTFSRIDAPRRKAVIHGPTTVQGVAFAGVRGIKSVEVSTDGGHSWSAATLKPPLSSQAWVFWSWHWANPRSGQHVLTARATDGTGTVQTSKHEGAPPDGASGYHYIPVHVA